ncbi:hypothetical protein [Metallibacterium scheffleri]|uniref:Uncharacterized protein n=1 Tax=Metallibacterium scheffleri TaxID=993689 RepID=A0A4S3KRR4_9GAMM|nr:hypothetical protein [Metallibacterium scheffleri]THD11646.1 hypothetical protein B1806_02610 [Metallibacterium scheffleri]
MTLYSLDAFQIGQRIQLHPATDQWMQGQRYAQVIRVGRKVITVKTDAGRTYRLLPQYICEIVE